MAKVRIGPKAHRVLDFLVGLGDRDAWQALEAQGFTEEELDEGWERLMALAIRDRRLLRSLGFRRGARADGGEES
jgi:hypothetical protein